MRRLPFLSALVVLTICLLITLTAATQYALLSSASGINLSVAPWASWAWVPSWFSSNPDLVSKWSLLQAVGFGFSFMCSALVFHFLRKNKPVLDMHGTARWATTKEIETLDLFGNEGVFVGGVERGGKMEYLRHDGAEHVLVAAPTRSGKGVSIVIPTLLTWPHSLFTIDIKGELWALTKPWREQYANQRCLKLDFANEDSAAFNPLDTVRIGTARQIGDIQNIVTLLVDPEGQGMEGQGGHWKKAAHALLTGLVTYALHEGDDPSFRGVLNLVNPPDRAFEDVLNEMSIWQDESADVQTVVRAAARQQLERAGEEAASVLSTTANYLTLYRDSIISKNTSHSDFSVHDLVNGSQAMSLYLAINPADKARVQSLTRLVVSVILRSLTQELRFDEGRAQSVNERRLLLLLDEFPALGKLDVITDTLAYMASYGIKAMLVIQDYSQLWATYGKDESITANCHIRTAFAPNKIETAKQLSEMTGTTTQVKRQRRANGKMGIHTADESWQEVSRPLMTPDEVLRLRGPVKKKELIIKAGEMLIFPAGAHPIRGTQPLYFQNESLLARSNVRDAQ